MGDVRRHGRPGEGSGRTMGGRARAPLDFGLPEAALEAHLITALKFTKQRQQKVVKTYNTLRLHGCLRLLKSQSTQTAFPPVRPHT